MSALLIFALPKGTRRRVSLCLRDEPVSPGRPRTRRPCDGTSCGVAIIPDGWRQGHARPVLRQRWSVRPLVDAEAFAPAHPSQIAGPFPPKFLGWRLESASASTRSWCYPFDHRPAGGIVDDKGSLRGALGDQRASFVGIVVDGGHVCQRQIKATHVSEARPIPPAHHVGRNGVPTLPDAPRRATRSSAVCGDGNHRNSKVTRQPLSRHAFNTLTHPRPDKWSQRQNSACLE